jgi:hypothetical protein
MPFFRVELGHELNQAIAGHFGESRHYRTAPPAKKLASMSFDFDTMFSEKREWLLPLIVRNNPAVPKGRHR